MGEAAKPLSSYVLTYGDIWYYKNHVITCLVCDLSSSCTVFFVFLFFCFFVFLPWDVRPLYVPVLSFCLLYPCGSGKLLAALLHGLSDRSSGVRRSYASCTGHVVKVSVLSVWGLPELQHTGKCTYL